MLDPSQMREALRRITSNAGVSGKLYIDASPKENFLRLKLVDVTNIDPVYLIELLVSLISEVGKGLNLEVRKYVREGGKNE